MNTKEFAGRCNVSPQIVRLWIRSGKLVRDAGGLVLADGFVLLPKVSVRRGAGCGGRTLLEAGDAGVSRRTIYNWLRDGKAVRGGSGTIYIREGWELQTCYRPVRRKEVARADGLRAGRLWK